MSCCFEAGIRDSGFEEAVHNRFRESRIPNPESPTPLAARGARG